MTPSAEVFSQSIIPLMNIPISAAKTARALTFRPRWRLRHNTTPFDVVGTDQLDRIGRRTVICMLMIVALGVVWDVVNSIGYEN